MLSPTTLVQEIPYKDPITVFALFAAEPFAIFLDSAKADNELGRYSFIAVDPFATLTSKNGEVKFNNETFTADPFIFLQQQLELYRQNTAPDLPPFQGGVAGYFAYDLCQHLEKLPTPKNDDLQFPDLMLGFYDVVIAFDHWQHQAWIFCNGYPEQDPDARIERAKRRLEYFSKRINENNVSHKTVSIVRLNNITANANFTTENYQAMVKKVIDYIYAGDIFQANVAQRFLANLAPDFDCFDLYCRLRKTNPAPFAAYLNFVDTIIASASPERFLKLTNNMIEARPIKGTRPRGQDQQEDNIFASELLNSEKDRAENTMIVDLLRNDLSRVCREHSVQVTELCGLESFATVHHLVSTIVAELKPEKDAIDLLRATFPGGSITGAPKIRAMEIIAELEPNQRGPYCGSIGYLGFDGAMDLSITIRTFAIKDNKLTFQVGGGIVAESDPMAEYEETLIKAAALERVLA